MAKQSIIKADITLETCNGRVRLIAAEYCVVQGGLITVKWHYGVTDHDLEKLYNIVETQLRTARAFARNDDDDEITFDYPMKLVTSMYENFMAE